MFHLSGGVQSAQTVTLSARVLSRVPGGKILQLTILHKSFHFHF